MKKQLLFLMIFGLLSSCTDTVTINSFIYYKVADECASMGKIEGEDRQNPLVGDYTTEVTAVPNEGYVFLRWNDNVLSQTRIDRATGDSFVTYVAYFEVANQ